jgi:oligopeptide/dipeptide ABC transporter ATP-binding protein
LPLLEVRNLRTHFPIRKGLLRGIVGYVRAVEDVSFDLYAGETLGLVGESGCGKTTVGRTILRLIEPKGGIVVSGRVTFRAKPSSAPSNRFPVESAGQTSDNAAIDLFSASPGLLRNLRRDMQIVFQDPVGSLNPRMTVGSMLTEPMLVHGLVERHAARKRVAELLDRVGLPSAAANRYPHEFSGGQRQRIGIARALALEPKFIVCDEPVSALDVSIQAQILNLLEDLQRDLGLSYLFIAHNLAVVEHFSDRVAVMYLGRIVEIAESAELYRNPKHPYTIALLSAVPKPTPRKDDGSGGGGRIVLGGEVPSPSHPPTGCPFHPRCPLYAQQRDPRCVNQMPPLDEKKGASPPSGHRAACWLTE